MQKHENKTCMCFIFSFESLACCFIRIIVMNIQGEGDCDRNDQCNSGLICVPKRWLAFEKLNSNYPSDWKGKITNNLIAQPLTAVWNISLLVDFGTQKMTAVNGGLFNIYPKLFWWFSALFYFLAHKLRLQMYIRPPMHPWRGPLYLRLRLWEKRIPHLQCTLHRYPPCGFYVQTFANVPRGYFWHNALPQQHQPQIFNIRYVLCSTVISKYIQSRFYTHCSF